MTVTVGGNVVVCSIHAAERALQRVPHLATASRDNASRWVELTAGRALRDGRKAVRCPRWCTRDWETGLKRRSKARRDNGTSRFVWNEEETVAFLVRRGRDRDPDATKPVWVVVTVHVPLETEPF